MTGVGLPFRFVGVVREFPTAPKDSFLVANSSYLASHVQSGLHSTILIRCNGDPSLIAREVSRIISPIAGAKVSDIATVQRQISSSLAAMDLRGLTLLELSFAIYFVLAIAYAIRMHMWGPIFFLLLFCFGYGYMGIMSLLQTAGGKRLNSVWRRKTAVVRS